MTDIRMTAAGRTRPRPVKPWRVSTDRRLLTHPVGVLEPVCAAPDAGRVLHHPGR